MSDRANGYLRRDSDSTSSLARLQCQITRIKLRFRLASDCFCAPFSCIESDRVDKLHATELTRSLCDCDFRSVPFRFVRRPMRLIVAALTCAPDCKVHWISAMRLRLHFAYATEIKLQRFSKHFGLMANFQSHHIARELSSAIG